METQQVTFKKIDRTSPEILRALATAPVYKKQGTVEARLATEGEKITTTLAGGTQETVNVAKSGDWVVMNPSGELYIISSEKFHSRYEGTPRVGVYQAKGHCRAIKNPFGQPIEIWASWGAPQFGDENCLVADTCDADGDNMGNSPYLIDAQAFAQTYAPKQ